MNQTTKKFDGFPQRPATNYWPYPKALNGWWHALTGSEQKVLDYILRHTWGYKKTADYISSRQLSNGIITRAGKQIDRGCGIRHRKTLKRAINGLVTKEFIIITKRHGKTTHFQLKWAKSEPLNWAEMNRRGSQNERVGGSRSEPTIKDLTSIKDSITEKQITEKQEKTNAILQKMREDLEEQGIIKNKTSVKQK